MKIAFPMLTEAIDELGIAPMEGQQDSEAQATTDPVTASVKSET
jgi:hypothetical protein